MIYLDSAATTSVAPEVLNEMLPYLKEKYGNAGTLYSIGRESADAIQKARASVARIFCSTPEHVIFTSGGSESNSTVFAGLRRTLLDSGKTHIVVSAIEHDSVIKAAESLMKDGFDVTYVKPSNDGVVSPRAIRDAIRDNTGLVSVMFVNNETGAINDIKEIGSVCKSKSVLFHTDCVQAAGQYLIDTESFGVDFASVSSHKIHGPKGVGALYVKDFSLSQLIHGGGEQEFGFRGGTENVPGIVGFGKAVEMSLNNMREDMIAVSTLKQKFYMALRNELKAKNMEDCIHVNGLPVVDAGKTLNVTVYGVDAETLLLMLDTNEVCISAGSACRSHEAVPSHVLTAMGFSTEDARSTVRISFSKYNRTDEVVSAAQIIASCIFSLKHMEA